MPTFQNVKVGEVIYREGYAGNPCIYAIAEGKVEITTKRGEIGAVVLAVLGKDEYFGESALLPSEPRATTARALTFCRLIVIDAKTIVDELDRASPVLRHLMRSLLHRYRRAVDGVPTDNNADPFSGIVSYANVLSLMAEAGSNDASHCGDASIAFVNAFERCQAISGHPRMHVMTMLRRMETLGLVSIVTVSASLRNKGAAIAGDEAAARRVIVFDPLQIVARAQRCADRDLGISIAKELEQAGVNSHDALLGVEKQLLLDKLSRGSGSTFNRSTEPAQHLDQLEPLADLISIDDRTLFDTVNAFHARDLAKMLVSAKHRTVSNRLLSVMTQAKQIEVSRIIRQDVGIDGVEVAEIEREFIRLLKSIKAGATLPSARLAT
jgi:CRP-like cAMP-binding protein